MSDYDPDLSHDRVREEYGMPPVSRMDKEWARKQIAFRMKADQILGPPSAYIHAYLRPDELMAVWSEEFDRRDDELFRQQAEKQRAERTARESAILLRPASVTERLLRPFEGISVSQRSDELLRAAE